MSVPVELSTHRLRLRPWLPQDRAPFAALNADPEMMAYFPFPLSRIESNILADHLQALLTQHGWGFWALELRATGTFIGFTGLHQVDNALPFSPATEVGWHLARPYWGEGLASEAARCALRYAFESLALPEVVAFTALGNTPSQAVMRRLGMRYDGEFEHPALPPGHPLRPHALYRMCRADDAAHILDA
ncbi:GNAT family N-acetyltransferase [Ottowia sp.]|uniref:GNAT family N-acetyltransferase n=1 Tax=Ottowia sp. TaxID=1898956 RepID=UPI003A87B2C2